MVISKKVEFSASHICRSAQLTDAENERVYGAAANPLGHGHNYVVEVAIEGEPDPVTGMILDLKRLREILEDKVINVYDHRLLNREVEPFAAYRTHRRKHRHRHLESRRPLYRWTRHTALGDGCTKPVNCLSSTGVRQ